MSKDNKTIYLKDYKKPDYTALEIDLNFQINGQEVRVENATRYQCEHDTKADLHLNRGKYPQLVEVQINGETTSDYTLNDDYLIIPHQGDEPFTLTVISTLTPKDNTDLEGLYPSGPVLCTQCEAEGFRNITFWQDRPDVMSVFTVTIEADKKTHPVLLSNGNKVDSGDVGNKRHFVKWHDPHKKPGHLFALVAGHLDFIRDSFKTKSGRTVDLRIYAPKQDMKQLSYAMHALKTSMAWDEEAYGREYDLDIFNIVSVHDFNSGAMENKSLNIFNAQLVLANPDTATDEDYNRILRVIGHEYFHNWSGNRVGLKQWFQLSLKEGFTVYRENNFAQAVCDPVIERIDEVRFLREMQFPEDAGPMAHPVRPEEFIEIRNFYTMTVYEKGSEVIGMMETLMGSKNFRKGCDLFFKRHDGDAATTEDFVACMEETSGMDMTQFKRWYQYAGTPHVSVKSDYKDGALTITMAQKTPDTPGKGQSNKKPMVIPVVTGFMGKDGKEIKNETLVLDEAEKSFTIDGFSQEPVPSYLRGFSAPITLETDMADSDYLFLMAHDTDGFNRWEASQKLGMAAILRRMAGGSRDQDYCDALITSIKTLHSHGKPLLARMLTPPEDSLIAQNVKTAVDPALIHDARVTVMRDIAGTAPDMMREIYDHNAPLSDTFDNSTAAIGRRALRNIALRLVTLLDEEEGCLLAQKQYDSALTMTERAGALSVLANTEHSARDACFNDFYRRFQTHELVLNKWFSLQAMAQREGIITDIKTLMSHEKFSLDNPNRLRSVIGAFSVRNMSGFHDASGEGYTLLADTIIALNGKNDQIAARLMTPLRQWTIFEAKRSAMMKTQIERILATPDLSNDIFEIADRCLNA